MSDNYLELKFKVTPMFPGVEILIAELGQAGFESFVETDEGVEAYIQKKEWKPDIMDEVSILRNREFDISFTSEEIEQSNWNETWEQNFEPITVSDNCVVRAPFHKPFGVEYEIIIEPKMSFGTGHHETTHMMLQFLLETDVRGQTVLDMGCGTAVLAILSEMRGASLVDAIDIDSWCVENSVENVERNNCRAIKVIQGDASELTSEEKYDTIIANINRNILLHDMPLYAKSLKSTGTMLLSGFYLEDLDAIKLSCNNAGLTYVEHKERNNWIAAKFVN